MLFKKISTISVDDNELNFYSVEEFKDYFFVLSSNKSSLITIYFKEPGFSIWHQCQRKKYLLNKDNFWNHFLTELKNKVAFNNKIENYYENTLRSIHQIQR